MANSSSSIQNFSKELFISFSIIVLLSICFAVYIEEEIFFLVPAAFLVGFITIVDFKKVYLLLFALVPLSFEYAFPNGFGTDLPTEPLMIGLMLVSLFYFLQDWRDTNVSYILHPISLLLFLHYFWIWICTIHSQDGFVSIKFALAKSWYLSVFFLIPFALIKNKKDIKLWIQVVMYPLLFALFVIFIRHALKGFSFESSHFVVGPFFRNHVNHAAITVLFLPFIWLLYHFKKLDGRSTKFVVCAGIFMIVAMYFSYTRAAYIAFIASIGLYFIIKFKLMKLGVGLSFLALIIGLNFMQSNNRFLEYAPNFERTVSHNEFSNLVSATYKGEDISTMERVYRWVAGFNMVAEKPFFGFGPGNFVNFYKSYTINSFKTYVSKNEDLSGIHSYYLMVAVDQGIVGVAIFFLLCIALLLYGEYLYHRIKDPLESKIIMAFTLCIAIILILQIINDLLETDKIGPFFFFAAAVLVIFDLKTRDKNLSKSDKLNTV